MTEVRTSAEAVSEGGSRLVEALGDLGARFGPDAAGVERPLDFGDPAGETAALLSGAGLVERRDHETLSLAGADRGRFLNGLVTCDVRELEPGTSVYGFFTEPKGHILADVEVLAEEERLLLVLPPGAAEAIVAHLGRYRVADRVEIAAVDRVTLAAVGPAAGERLAGRLEIGGTLAPGRHQAVPFGGETVVVARGGRFGDDVVLVLAPPRAAAALFTALAAEGGLRPAGELAFEAFRVERGLPLCGVDYGPENFPQETGLDAAVSYTKGCYLGQEVVARIHYRGGVQKLLRGLRFAAGAEPERGARVSFEGRSVGSLTSLARRLAGAPRGLAILHRRAEPGSQVEVEGAGSARVVEPGSES